MALAASALLGSLFFYGHLGRHATLVFLSMEIASLMSGLVSVTLLATWAYFEEQLKIIG